MIPVTECGRCGLPARAYNLTTGKTHHQDQGKRPCVTAQHDIHTRREVTQR